MSDSSYIAMQTPKRGLRNIGDPTYGGPEFRNAFDRSYVSEVFWAVLLGPFRTFGAILSGKLMITMILVFLGSFLNGAVFVFVQSNANAAATEQVLRSLILAIIASSVYYATSIWSYYDNFPTIIYPAQAMSMIGLTFTKKREDTFGLVVALMYLGFQFLGYSMAGLALRAFVVNTTTPLYNVSVTNQGYWLYWFGGTVIAFSFLFNRLFRQSPSEDDKSAKTASRSSVAAAVSIVFMTVGFYTLGINSYCSGLFTTQVIAYPSLPDTATLVNGVVPWAFYIFVDLLAVPATVVFLVMIMAVIQYYMVESGGKTKTLEDIEPSRAADAHVGAPITNVASNASSSRLTQRQKLNVQY